MYGQLDLQAKSIAQREEAEERERELMLVAVDLYELMADVPVTLDRRCRN
jgi:hypothetical protein